MSSKRTMRVIALVSGGKDSCYNMVQCVAEGHKIVALANLRPPDKDEMDSYMFQVRNWRFLFDNSLSIAIIKKTRQ